MRINHKWKRCMSGFLAVSMVLTMLPLSVFADETVKTETTTQDMKSVLEQAPTEQAPTEQAPTEQAPTEQAPTEQAPTEQAPTEQAPTEQAPTEQAPTEQAPTEQAPTEQAPTEQAPTEQPLSYYEQLLACGDAESMIALLEDQEQSAILSREELSTLIERAESFVSDEEGATSKADLLAVLATLSEQKQAEMPPVVPNLSFYEQLLACEDAESMYLLLLSDQQAAMILTLEELAQLIALVESFPEDAEGISDRVDLLDTLALLSGVPLEGEPDILDEVRVSAAIYDKEQNGRKLVTLSSSNTADLGNWKQGENRYVLVDVSGLSQHKKYELVVEMQPILRVASIPDIANASYTYEANTMTVNQDSTYTASNYSGTIVWTLDEGTTDCSFQFQLNYDLTLWNKRAGELSMDLTKPMLSISIREVSEEDPTVKTEQDKVSLHKAQAQSTFEETVYILMNGKTSNANLMNTDSVNFGLERMVNSNYSSGFYYPKITFHLTIPKCTYKDANNKNQTCYLIYDESSTLKTYQKGGTAEYDIKYDKDNHSIDVTLYNYYSMDNTQFDGLKFTAPEVLKDLAPGAYSFVGDVTITWYRSAGDTEGVVIKPKSLNKNAVSYANTRESMVKRYSSQSVVSVEHPDVISHFATYGLYNLGFDDSGEYRINMEFDTKDTNMLHVTTVRLLADNVQENLELKYSLIDGSGEVVVENGILTIPNPYTELDENGNLKTASMENVSHLLTTDMLPEEQRNYYFKTLEYTLKKVPGNTYLYAKSSNKSPSSGGTIWGYAEGEMEQKATISVTVNSVSPDGTVTPNTEDLNRNLTVTIGAPDSTYMLTHPQVDKKQIQAGDTVTISGSFEITNYPYGNTQVVDTVRLGLQLPQGISFDVEDVTAVTSGSNIMATNVSVQGPTNEIPMWIVEFSNPSVKVGYMNRDLQVLPDGNAWNFSIKLHTETYLEEQTLTLRNILWAAGDGQPNRAGGAKNGFNHSDFDNVDLNNYTNNSDPTKDTVACFDPSNTTAFTIKVKPASLDIHGSIVESGESSGDASAALKHFADHVTYQLKIACTDGGESKDFYYLIPIPRKNSVLEDYFVSKSEVDLKMTAAASVYIVQGAQYSLLYTTESNLSYDSASAKTDGWLTADQIDGNTIKWEDITMIKVICADSHITSGSEAVVSVPLYYRNNNYDYADDAQRFISEAGMVVQFSARGYYTHTKGVQSITGSSSTDSTTVRLEYTVPEMKEITLTAQKMTGLDEKPETAYATVEIPAQFLNKQNYEVRKVEATGVELVSSGSVFSVLNNNTHFAIALNVNDGEKQDLRSDASVKDPVEIGTVAEKEEALFEFEIFCGDSISDVVRERRVVLDIIGHNGVTIPVTINIICIATEAESVKPAIRSDKIYTRFDKIDTPVLISQGSSLTAQFVVKDIVPDNYPTRTLVFDHAPSADTTILMIDWTTEIPKYYHYKLHGNETDVDLTSFTAINGEDNYVNPSGQTAIEQETLLFLLDFADKAVESSTSISLERPATKESKLQDIIDTLSYQVGDARVFDLTTFAMDKDEEISDIVIGEAFRISYNSRAPQGANMDDNRYSTRRMALVLESEKALPVDLCLKVEGEYYNLNQKNQIIVPLGAIGSGTIEATLLSEVFTGPLVITTKLYTSATSNDTQPLWGEQSAQCQWTVKSDVMPAFAVTNMDQRVFFVGSDSMKATLNYRENIPDDCVVEMTMMQKVSNSNTENGYFKTDVPYVDYLNNQQVQATTVKLTDLNGRLDLQFKKNLPIGTYRLLFTVKEGNEVLLTVPYNFLIIPKE